MLVLNIDNKKKFRANKIKDSIKQGMKEIQEMRNGKRKEQELKN